MSGGTGGSTGSPLPPIVRTLVQSWLRRAQPPSGFRTVRSRLPGHNTPPDSSRTVCRVVLATAPETDYGAAGRSTGSRSALRSNGLEMNASALRFAVAERCAAESTMTRDSGQCGSAWRSRSIKSAHLQTLSGKESPARTLCAVQCRPAHVSAMTPERRPASNQSLRARCLRPSIPLTASGAAVLPGPAQVLATL
jgi:hypothetical protein